MLFRSAPVETPEPTQAPTPEPTEPPVVEPTPEPPVDGGETGE